MKIYSCFLSLFFCFNLCIANFTLAHTRAESFLSARSIGIGSGDFVVAAEKSIPSVVHIKTSFKRKNAYYDDFYAPFREFFNLEPFSQQYPINASGSGVVVRPDGYIVTNNHVIEDAEEITVTLNDKREYSADVVGLDPSTDLALIKINEVNLPYLNFGNSDNLKVGEWVLAVGNPFNLTSTVTAGIVSAKARNINILGGGSSVESFIQTDAAVNPGNSGGALVNINGELVGINAAIASNTGSYSGYSFAIPSNIAGKVVNDLLQYGLVQRAYFGAKFSEINAANAKSLGLTSLRGVYVGSVNEGGAAYIAGIEQGDVVFSFENEDVNNAARLLELIAEKSPGDKVKVNIDRKGKAISKTLTLLNRSGSASIVKKNNLQTASFLGATFQMPENNLLQRLRLKNGVQIEILDKGALKNAGVKEGFIITKIDNKEIKSLDDLEEFLYSKSGGILIEGYYPNGVRAYYGLGI